MKVIIPRICVFLVLTFLVSCVQEPEVFRTNKSDYDHFLVSGPLKTIPANLQFEVEANSDSMQLPGLWNLTDDNMQIFRETGDVKFLKNSERTLKKAVELATTEKSGFIRALSRNYMLQHRFKEALLLAEEARALGTDVEATQSLLFDLHMELGNYGLANKYLDSIKDVSSYEYRKGRSGLLQTRAQR